jgi:hypothetical protein
MSLHCTSTSISIPIECSQVASACMAVGGLTMEKVAQFEFFFLIQRVYNPWQ